MAMLRLTDDELWKKVEGDRLREERLREPYLMAFRTLPQKISLRESEDAHQKLRKRDIQRDLRRGYSECESIV